MNEKCFAEVGNGKCAVLTVHKCPGHEKCSFFKSEEQVESEKAKNFERIASLTEDEQICISKAFYNGKMPWYEVHKK